jgi:hypothetical protein
MRRRARRQPPPDLTSLFDVLFIVIFAALIRAAAVQQAAAAPARPEPTPAPPIDPASLRARALVDLGADLAARPTIVMRISAAGTIATLEVDSKLITLDVPLLEHSPDPDVELSYLGDRSAELRACRVAALHLGVPDLSRYLVIFAPALRLADLPHALFDGLHRDVDRCLADQHGLAVIVDPTSGAVTP